MWKLLELSDDHSWTEVSTFGDKSSFEGFLTEPGVRIAVPAGLDALDHDTRHALIREAFALNKGVLVRVLSGARIEKIDTAGAACPNACYCMVSEDDHYCEVSYCDGSHCWSVRCNAGC